MTTTDFETLAEDIMIIRGFHLATLEDFQKEPHLANLAIFKEKEPHTKGRQSTLGGKILPKGEGMLPNVLGICSICQRRVDITLKKYFVQDSGPIRLPTGITTHYYSGYCYQCYTKECNALSLKLKPKWKPYVEKYGIEQARAVIIREIQGDNVEFDKANCTMCGTEMIFIKRDLPFKDKCRKCNYSFTFVYKKEKQVKVDPRGEKKIYYVDGIKPTRPKAPTKSVKSTGREPIPQDVMDAVWNRDGGQCVKCGSNQDLEYDHMIPLSKGGSNRYRNLQLLCENCNRDKSDNIG